MKMKFLDVVAPEMFEEDGLWFVIIGLTVVLVAIICLIVFFIRKKRGNSK